jgi:hypothetical protein
VSVERAFRPGADPTTSIYNASVVCSRLERF